MFLGDPWSQRNGERLLASVKASDFIQLPSRLPAVNEAFDFAFLEDCIFLIFALKTTLKDVSFLKHIGRRRK